MIFKKYIILSCLFFLAPLYGMGGRNDITPDRISMELTQIVAQKKDLHSQSTNLVDGSFVSPQKTDLIEHTQRVTTSPQKNSTVETAIASLLKMKSTSIKKNLVRRKLFETHNNPEDTLDYKDKLKRSRNYALGETINMQEAKKKAAYYCDACEKSIHDTGTHLNTNDHKIAIRKINSFLTGYFTSPIKNNGEESDEQSSHYYNRGTYSFSDDEATDEDSEIYNPRLIPTELLPEYVTKPLNGQLVTYEGQPARPFNGKAFFDGLPRKQKPIR